MKTIKLGFVDDHTLFREGVKSLISKMPEIDLLFDVEDRSTLEAQLQRSLPDVLLLDLNLDGDDGIEITKWLKVDYPSLKIIILTMHREERMISYLMEIGASAYLLKDTGKEELELAIQKAHEDGVYINSLVSKVILKQLKVRNEVVPSIGNKFDLTKRELTVLKLISEELTTAEIAEKLFLSARTIEGYRKTLLSKLGVRNSAGLVLKAIKENILST